MLTSLLFISSLITGLTPCTNELNLVNQNKNVSNVEANSSNKHESVYYYATSPLENNTSYPEVYATSSNDGKFVYTSDLYELSENPFKDDLFYTDKDFLKTYYNHLKTNIPFNNLGICGYTGISMFLSFFDSYWNDDFIAEQYDAVTSLPSNLLNSTKAAAYESPGIIDESITQSIGTLKQEIKNDGITDENSTAFKEALDRKLMAIINNQIDHDTFLGKLFDIGLRYGAIVPHFDENEYHASNEYLEGIGVNNNVMNTVLSNYVKENENLYGKIKIVSSRIGDKDGTTEEESKRIRNEIVEIVKTGRPVLMGGDNIMMILMEVENLKMVNLVAAI